MGTFGRILLYSRDRRNGRDFAQEDKVPTSFFSFEFQRLFGIHVFQHIQSHPIQHRKFFRTKSFKLRNESSWNTTSSTQFTDSMDYLPRMIWTCFWAYASRELKYRTSVFPFLSSNSSYSTHAMVLSPGHFVLSANQFKLELQKILLLSNLP